MCSVGEAPGTSLGTPGIDHHHSINIKYDFGTVFFFLHPIFLEGTNLQ